MPSGSRLDHVYRSILMTKFFTKGWGKPENLKRLFAFRKIVSNREACYNLVSKDYPITITKEELQSDCKILEGKFTSPFVAHLPGLLPKEAEIAYFQVVLPRKWNTEHYKPICIHLAGTGDHGFWRRRQILAKPLLRSAGIGAIILENPFYGLRKPKDQVRSSLHNVSDIFVMGGCLILESLALFHWCEHVGLGPLGITGMSMGGHMASLAATNWPKPIALVPCLSWSTASPVFTQGVMSESINWDLLQTQYYSDGIYRQEIRKMVCTEEDAFRAGQHFAKYYPESMQRINELNKESQVKKTNTKDATKVTSSPDTHLDKLSASPSAISNTSLEKNCEPSPAKPAEPPASDTAEIPSPKGKLAKWRDRESLQFMRGIMDECTHLSNFEVPIDTSLIIAVCARDDAYVPREGCTDLTDIWPGAEVRYLEAGHVSAYVLHQQTFRGAIMDSFDRMKKKYYLENCELKQ